MIANQALYHWDIRTTSGYTSVGYPCSILQFEDPVVLKPLVAGTGLAFVYTSNGVMEQANYSNMLFTKYLTNYTTSLAANLQQGLSFSILSSK